MFPRSKSFSKFYLIIQSSFLIAWLTNVSNLGTGPTDSMFCVYALCAVIGVFSFTDNYLHHSQHTFIVHLSSSFVGILFSLITIIANYKRFAPLTDLLNLFDLMCSFIGGSILGYSVIIFLLNRLPVNEICGVEDFRVKNERLVFFFSFFLVASVSLVHLFFVEYPGNLTNDSFSQLRQIISGQYSNHHPFWHTVILGFFFKIGCFFFKDYSAAVALYIVWQILFMSLCYAYTVVTLYQAGISRKTCGLIIFFYGFMPYNLAFIISVTKDVIFSGAILLFIVSVFRILKGIGKSTLRNHVILFISSVCVCIWRSNGSYAFLASILFFSFFLYKKYKGILVSMICAFILGWSLTNPLLSALHISQPDLVESLSIPVQQVARVITDNCELTQEQYALLDQIVDVESISDIYTDWLSDPIKDAIRQKNNLFFESHFHEYTKLWIDLGLKYPAEYVKAWIDQTKGYWNGGYDYFTYSLGVSHNDLGISEGLNNNLIAKISHAVFKICRGAVFMAPFESIGLNVWILFVLFYVNWVKGKREMLLSVPALAVVLTLLVATPVFAQFRYAYPVFITVPFVLCVSIFQVPDRT